MKLFRYSWLCLFALPFLMLFWVTPPSLAFSEGKNYTLYVGNTSKDCAILRPQHPALAKKFCGRVCGEQVSFSHLSVEDYMQKMGATLLFLEELSDSTNYYCSAPLPYRLNLYGREVNLHICVREEGVTVATPIIFGGY